MPGFTKGELVADRYEVQDVLGRGGMGEVYLVYDQLTRQQLALKTLLPQYVANERAVQRFVREVTTVRKLDHPGIVRIYDAQRVGRLLYYTMDYVQGKSLRKWIQQRGRLGMGSTVRVLSLLCSALEHAHQFTVHRDISPDNVMVIGDGSIKLLDFGLAKLTDTDQALTRIGVSLGKLQYNSPEQRASAADVDHRADIYSLGVMFFEMLSGQIPKLGQRLTTLVPELPAECDAFVAKAMAADPQDRFPSAYEFRIALAGLYQLYEEHRAKGISPSEAPTAAPTPRFLAARWAQLKRALFRNRR